MDNRVDELSRFIERPTTRLKETERLLARQLEVSDRELVLLRTLVADGPMITEELGGCFRVPVSTVSIIDFTALLDVTLRPVFDFVWNGGGWPGSPNYRDGRWVAPTM